jgi:tRNA threonylcarbamoyladenosine biosynthesis protein TsaE
MAESIAVDVSDLQGTMALGRRLGQGLFGGAVVALIGQLGAGKTHFVRAVAEGLGLKNSLVVSSPTFVLIQEYPARLPVYHFDAYRLQTPQDFADLGVHEYFSGEGVCLVEWADRVEAILPPEYLRVAITITGETSRRFEFEGRGRRYEEVVQALS